MDYNINMPNITDIISEYFKPGYISDDYYHQIIDKYVSTVILSSTGMKQADKKKLKDSISTPDKIIISGIDHSDILHRTINSIVLENVLDDLADTAPTDIIILKYFNAPILYVENNYIPIVRFMNPIHHLCQDIDVDTPTDIEKIIECTEKRDRINIIAFANYPENDDDDYVLVQSSQYNRIFDSRLPTNVYFYRSHHWYPIEYLNLETNEIVDFTTLMARFSNINQLLAKYLQQKQTITYEPSDIGKDLPIIEILVGEKNIQLFVGSTYNLYLVSSHEQLVGSLDISNYDAKTSAGKATIRWVRGYPGKL